MYRRVSYVDRCQIFAFLAVKKPPKQIAKKLGMHPSTIYREIKRNSGERYQADAAEELAQTRKIRCRKPRLIKGDLEALIREKLARRWSPEEIAKRLMRERKRNISHSTIYRFIHARPEEKPLWEKCLRRYRKRRGNFRRSAGKTMRYPWALSIKERPKIVANRSRFGDWERDTMYGKDRRMLLVCSERKSRLVKLAVLKLPLAINVTTQTKALLDEASYRPLRTITNDNGGELLDGFDFNVPVYYCQPGRPHQRGTVENTIGLIRQYLPKQADLATLTDQEIRKIEDELNMRPRKCLAWRTPHEVFFGKSIALAM